jgi:hypothetical protein
MPDLWIEHVSTRNDSKGLKFYAKQFTNETTWTVPDSWRETDRRRYAIEKSELNVQSTEPTEQRVGLMNGGSVSSRRLIVVDLLFELDFAVSGECYSAG